MLCNACENLIERMWDRRWTPEWGTTIDARFSYERAQEDNKYHHHLSYQSLVEAAASLCYICHRLAQKFDEYWPREKRDNNLNSCQLFTTAFWDYPYEGAENRIYIGLSTTAMRLEFIEKFTDGSDEILGTFDIQIIKGTKLMGVAHGRSTQSALSSRILRSWIRNCVKSHAVCKIGRKEDWYPTRLLDLGNMTSDNSVKVIETQKTQLKGPYMTLSHCWGSQKSIQLTKSTYHHLTTRIAICDLPPTFVNAIQATLSLGVRYLLIDALTIIQGDSQDWEKEASLMQHVYQNSYCNIAATSSRDSQGGLFFPREPSLVNPAELPIRNELSNLWWTEYWNTTIDDGPLMERGWIAQERWLCPRMLHFGKEQLFWECLTECGCETTPKGLPHDVRNRHRLDRFKFDERVLTWKPKTSYRRARGLRSSRTESQLWAQWDRILKSYSRTLLTFESDKLIALSGISRAIQRELQDEYIAGLWKKDIIIQLAWTTGIYFHKDGKMVPSRTKEYIAPSWSWASVNGPIENAIRKNKLEFRSQIQAVAVYLGHRLAYVGNDKFGQVKSGYIQIQAPIHEVTISSTPQVEFPYRRYRMNLDGSIEDVRVFDKISIDVDDGNVDWTESFACLTLYTEGSSDERLPSTLFALLLRKYGSSCASYSRVGLMQIRQGLEIDYFSTPVEIPCLPKELFHPEKGYIIKIF